MGRRKFGERKKGTGRDATFEYMEAKKEGRNSRAEFNFFNMFLHPYELNICAERKSIYSSSSRLQDIELSIVVFTFRDFSFLFRRIRHPRIDHQEQMREGGKERERAIIITTQRTITTREQRQFAMNPSQKRGREGEQQLFIRGCMEAKQGEGRFCRP